MKTIIEPFRIKSVEPIRPLVARTYPLAEIKRAQDDFKAKTFFGKLVVLPY